MSEPIVLKDFMGNDLKVGDIVCIADCTYSKTPYLVYGEIAKIESPYFYKNGNFKSVTIRINVSAKSDYSLQELRANNYKLPDSLKGVLSIKYRDNGQSFISILKIAEGNG